MRERLAGIGLMVLALLWFEPAAAAVTQSRTALIVGNDAYEHLPPLQNAVNDARALDARLRALGFETILKVNAGGLELNRAIYEFGGKVQPGGVGLVFYAGHGIEAGGRNYLIPVDAQLQSDVDLRFAAIDVDAVLGALKDARAALNVVILDACRDNPLPNKGRSTSRGLARVSPPSGTFVAYAAGPGEVAADGDAGGNGVFTGELLKALNAPGLKIEEVFKQVASGVRSRTGGRQEPWTQASITGDFYFVPPIAAAPVVRPSNPPVTAVPAFDPRAMELAFWESIKDSDRPADYEAYLKRYSEGTFVDLARVRLSALKEREVASLPPSGAAAPAAVPSGPPIVELDDSYVTLKTSNLRSDPTTDASKVGTLGSDTLVQATGRLSDGSWVRISHAGGVAWVWGKLVEPVDAAEHGAWTKASGGDAPALEAFLKAYPGGRYAEAAQARLASLRAPPAAVVASPAPAAKPAVGVYPQSRGPGAVFQDCADCPELVVLPQGSYTMGSPSSEGGRDDDEGPQHRVRIGYGLAVGKYEVTVEEYRRFVRSTGHTAGNSCWTYETGKWEEHSGRGWENPGFSQGSRDPVVCVSWEDAQSYLRWLSRETGQSYRLLSESEWEYAARAGTTTPFHTGSRITTAQANLHGNQTVPVGGFGANLFGLHDMHGNVWEWVEDCLNGSYAGAPSDGLAWRSGECGVRVLRGGSWIGNPTDLRSAYRDWFDTGYRSYVIGFRVARTL